jgi:hypothetical protein
MRGFGILGAARASMMLALAIAGLASTSRAATKHQNPPPGKAPFLYNTTGLVNYQAAPSSVTGPALLQYQGVTGATFTPGIPIQLGQFVVPASTATNGQATTYDNTPFVIQLRAPEFDKTSSVPLLDKAFPKLGRQLSLKTVNESSLLIRGELNGTVSPTGLSQVVATVNSIQPGGLELKTQDHVTHYSFPVRFADLKLPPSWTMSATPQPSPLAAAQTFTPAPAPEPSTIAIFATALGGVVLARRRTSRRGPRPDPVDADPFRFSR